MTVIAKRVRILEGLKSFLRSQKDIIAEAVGRQRKSLRKLALEPDTRGGKKRSYIAVYRELKKSGIKPLHVISKPNITQQQREDRAWFCGSFLKDWDVTDSLHVAALDEFFIYTVRKPNHKNDIIWATKLDDIREDVMLTDEDYADVNTEDEDDDDDDDNEDDSDANEDDDSDVNED
ncbi:probable DNA-directed RNA polymerase subunit delta [Macrobrachium nipponense]|uniref:probable DNA-directed RNA polymerase subunit delta n=1 Tax=Macrobrachium nipponense TaxID=159736 RepID=UPI0030C7E06E